MHAGNVHLLCCAIGSLASDRHSATYQPCRSISAHPHPATAASSQSVPEPIKEKTLLLLLLLRLVLGRMAEGECMNGRYFAD